MESADYGMGGDGDGWDEKPWEKYNNNNRKGGGGGRKSPGKSSSSDEGFSEMLLGTFHGFSVYIESHQGKHCVSGWPGHQPSGKQGPYFVNGMVNRNNQPLFRLLCLSDEFRDAVTAPTADGANGLLFFNFGKVVCGIDGQTSCQLQWKRVGNNIFIHGCPDPKGVTMGNFLDIKSLKGL